MSISDTEEKSRTESQKSEKRNEIRTQISKCKSVTLNDEIIIFIKIYSSFAFKCRETSRGTSKMRNKAINSEMKHQINYFSFISDLSQITTLRYVFPFVFFFFFSFSNEQRSSCMNAVVLIFALRAVGKCKYIVIRKKNQ